MPNLKANDLFSQKLKQLMSEKGGLYSDLAEYLGVGKSTVSMWTSGKSLPRTEMLNRIANYFNVSISELMGYEYLGGGFYGKEAPKEIQEKFMQKLIGRKAEMNRHMDKLNDVGQQEAVRQVELLTKIPEYRKEDTPDES